MQWHSGKNAGFSDAEETYLPVIDDEVYGYQKVNVAVQEADPDSYLNWTRFLVKTRQGEKGLRAGDFAWVETGNTAVLAFKRFTEDGEVLCLFNLSDQEQMIGGVSNRPLRDILSRSGLRYLAEELRMLEPFAAHWLKNSQ